MNELLECFIKTEYFNSLSDDSSNVLDSVTGIISRKYIRGYLDYITLKGCKYTLVMFDIDNFKDFNDSYGHIVGDEVLYVTAQKILQLTPKGSFVGRYGGDEFITILNGEYSYDDLWAFLKKTYIEIRKGVELSNGKKITVTVTSGSASCPKDGTDVLEILTKADKALYRGKMKGRNCFIIYLDEKHKNLKFKEPKSIYEMMNEIRKNFKPDVKIRYAIHEALIDIWEEFTIDGIIYFPKSKDLKPIYSADNNNIKELDFNIVNNIQTDNAYIINSRDESEFVKVNNYLKSYNISSCIFMISSYLDNEYGYILAYCNHNRVWQDSNLAVIRYLADIAAYNLEIYYNNKK